MKLFYYTGGKSSKLSWLHPLLPPTRRYVEPFLGSGVVYLTRNPRSRVNVLNDKDDHLVNLFQQVRDNEDALRRRLMLTLHSETDFLMSADPTDDPLERARRTFINISLGISHVRHDNPKPYKYGKQYRDRVRLRIDNAIAAMPQVAKDLRKASLLCRDATAVVTKINEQDDIDTLIYCDPPYTLDTRSTNLRYGCDMSDAEQSALLDTLTQSPHKVAISGYANSLYDERLAGWRRHERKFARKVMLQRNSKSSTVTEVLWTNYEVSTDG